MTTDVVEWDDVDGEASASAGEVPTRNAGIDVGARVFVAGLEARPDLNGQEGTVVEPDLESAVGRRWKVLLDMDGSSKKIHTANLRYLQSGGHEDLVLRVEARVRILGLPTHHAELNGLAGTLLLFDEVQQRWKVQIDGGPRRMLKAKNLRHLHVSSFADNPVQNRVEQWAGSLAAVNEHSDCQALQDLCVLVPRAKWNLDLGAAGASADLSASFAEIQFATLRRSLRQRHQELWAEVLPAVEVCINSKAGIDGMFAVLASSPAFRSMFSGTRRQPFVLPRNPFVSGLMSLRALSRGLCSNSWTQDVAPYNATLIFPYKEHLQGAVPLPMVESQELLDESARFGSVVVACPEGHWRPIARLVLAAVKHLQVLTESAIWYTGGNQVEPLTPSSERCNVMIFQVCGHRRWRVFRPSQRCIGINPVEWEQLFKQKSNEDLPEPILDIELRPGQTLFIPLGFLFLSDTRCMAESSLHVQLSMYPLPTYMSLQHSVLAKCNCEHNVNVSETSLSDEYFWKLVGFVPAGSLAPCHLRRDAEPGRALVSHIADELCRHISMSIPECLQVSKGGAESTFVQLVHMAVLTGLSTLREELQLAESELERAAASAPDFSETGSQMIEPRLLVPGCAQLCNQSASFSCKVNLRGSTWGPNGQGLQPAWPKLPQELNDVCKSEFRNLQSLLKLLDDRLPALRTSSSAPAADGAAARSVAAVAMQRALAEGRPPPPEALALLTGHSNAARIFGSTCANPEDPPHACAECSSLAVGSQAGGWPDADGTWYCATCWQKWGPLSAGDLTSSQTAADFTRAMGGPSVQDASHASGISASALIDSYETVD